MHGTVPRERCFPPAHKLSHSLPPVPRGPGVWAVCPPWTLASHPAPEPGAHEEEEEAVLRQQTAFRSVVTHHPGCHRLGCHRLGCACGASRRHQPLPSLRVPSSRAQVPSAGLRARNQGFHLWPFPKKTESPRPSSESSGLAYLLISH